MTSWPQNQVSTDINGHTLQSTGLASKHQQSNYSYRQTTGILFLCDKLCPAKTFPAFDIKQMLISHCERGCLQISMGCSHYLMHAKKAILGGQLHIISYVVRKGGALTEVVSDYWPAEPCIQGPYQTML